MTLIHAPANALPVWPYDLQRLRQDRPNVSFAANPSRADLEHFDVLEVQETTPPPHDARLERLEQAPPQLVDGVWQQRWTVRDATPEEVAAYDEANAPGPDWARFKLALLPDPAAPGGSAVAINQAIALAFQAVPVAVLGLSSGLAKAEAGDLAEFSGSWRAVLLVAPPPAEALAELVALAQDCNLPTEFVGAVQGQRIRARDAQGRFIADDPATPDVDEAWV